jgi:hypothetical protein
MLVNVIMENPVNSGSAVVLFLASLSIAAVSEQVRSHGTGRLIQLYRSNTLFQTLQLSGNHSADSSVPLSQRLNMYSGVQTLLIEHTER